MKYKVKSLIICALMCISVFSGCSNDNIDKKSFFTLTAEGTLSWDAITNVKNYVVRVVDSKYNEKEYRVDTNRLTGLNLDKDEKYVFFLRHESETTTSGDEILKISNTLKAETRSNENDGLEVVDYSLWSEPNGFKGDGTALKFPEGVANKTLNVYIPSCLSNTVFSKIVAFNYINPDVLKIIAYFSNVEDVEPRMIAGQEIDIALVNITQMNSLINKNLISLLDTVTDDVTQYGEIKSDLKDLAIIENSVYGIPATVLASCMYYNKDLDSEFPETYEDFLSKLDEIDSSKQAFSVFGNTSMLFETLLAQNGERIFNSENANGIFNKDDGYNAFQVYANTLKHYKNYVSPVYSLFNSAYTFSAYEKWIEMAAREQNINLSAKAVPAMSGKEQINYMYPFFMVSNSKGEKLDYVSTVMNFILMQSESVYSHDGNGTFTISNTMEENEDYKNLQHVKDFSGRWIYPNKDREKQFAFMLLESYAVDAIKNKDITPQVYDDFYKKFEEYISKN